MACGACGGVCEGGGDTAPRDAHGSRFLCLKICHPLGNPLCRAPAAPATLCHRRGCPPSTATAVSCDLRSPTRFPFATARMNPPHHAHMCTHSTHQPHPPCCCCCCCCCRSLRGGAGQLPQQRPAVGRQQPFVFVASQLATAACRRGNLIKFCWANRPANNGAAADTIRIQAESSPWPLFFACPLPVDAPLLSCAQAASPPPAPFWRESPCPCPPCFLLFSPLCWAAIEPCRIGIARRHIECAAVATPPNTALYSSAKQAHSITVPFTTTHTTTGGGGDEI